MIFKKTCQCNTRHMCNHPAAPLEYMLCKLADA